MTPHPIHPEGRPFVPKPSVEAGIGDLIPVRNAQGKIEYVPAWMQQKAHASATESPDIMRTTPEPMPLMGANKPSMPPPEMPRLDTPAGRVQSALGKIETRTDVPVAIEKFRANTGLPKEQFDQAVMGLYANGKVRLYRHDAPYLLSDAERNMLVHDPERNIFYNGISWPEQ